MVWMYTVSRKGGMSFKRICPFFRMSRLEDLLISILFLILSDYLSETVSPILTILSNW